MTWQLWHKHIRVCKYFLCDCGSGVGQSRTIKKAGVALALPASKWPETDCKSVSLQYYSVIVVGEPCSEGARPIGHYLGDELQGIDVQLGSFIGHVINEQFHAPGIASHA